MQAAQWTKLHAQPTTGAALGDEIFGEVAKAERDSITGCQGQPGREWQDRRRRVGFIARAGAAGADIAAAGIAGAHTCAAAIAGTHMAAAVIAGTHMAAAGIASAGRVAGIAGADNVTIGIAGADIAAIVAAAIVTTATIAATALAQILTQGPAELHLARCKHLPRIRSIALAGTLALGKLHMFPPNAVFERPLEVGGGVPPRLVAAVVRRPEAIGGGGAHGSAHDAQLKCHLKGLERRLEAEGAEIKKCTAHAKRRQPSEPEQGRADCLVTCIIVASIDPIGVAITSVGLGRAQR